MRSMYDAIGVIRGLGTDATAFYIGGEDAFRVWPESEIQRIDTRFRLPIWVNSIPSTYAHGQSDGYLAGKWGKAHNQQPGTNIALDYETAVNSEYLKGFDNGVMTYGYHAMLYGSESTVLSNPRPSGGYWVAVWNGVNSPEGWAAHQYADRGSYDISAVADSTPLWDTQSHVPPPPPVPTPTNWTETLVNNLPTVSVGSTGQAVRDAQGLLNAHGASLNVDGVFGNLTDAATRNFQQHFSVPGGADGVIGQHTWTSLLTV